MSKDTPLVKLARRLTSELHWAGMEVRPFKLSPQEWEKLNGTLDRSARMKPRLKRLFAEPTILERK